LAAAKGAPKSDVVNYLQQVLTDDDIISGVEPIRPDWVSLYDSVKASLPDRLRSIPFPSPISPVASLIDPRSLKLSFLLGAGASKPSPSDIPTVKELLPDLLSRARRLDRDDVTRLANFCDRTRITNIEDLLTAAQIAEFCARNKSVLTLEEFLLYRENETSGNDDIFYLPPDARFPKSMRLGREGNARP
jgi:hypothetical protein